MQKIIVIIWKLPERLKLLRPPTAKWRLFQFLPIIIKNSFCLADTFQLNKYQLFVFPIVFNIHERKLSSGKFRLNKYFLFDKRPVEHAILLFLVFSFLERWDVFCQKDEFSKFWYVTNLYDLENFYIKIMVLWRKGYCSLANWGCIN